MLTGKIEIYKDILGEWRFRLRARNGEIVSGSQGYRYRWTAVRGAKRFKKLAETSPIIKVESDYAE